MYKIFNLLAFVILLLTVACQPPVKTIPRRVKTGLDSLPYAAVLESREAQNLLSNRPLATILVKDRGWSRDCEYPEVVERARNKAKRLGANVLVIVEHTLPDQTGSSCSRIRAEVYRVPSLEGLESQIRWDSSRPLMAGDLRGSAPAGVAGLPVVQCVLKYRLLGDFFNAITVRTQTIFLSDNTWMPADPGKKSQFLRRAQLHFNLAELAARGFKTRLTALAPNLKSMTGQAKSMLAEQQSAAQQRAATFDTEWMQSGLSEAVLLRWEQQVAAELAASASLFPDKTVSLKKQDYRKSD